MGFSFLFFSPRRPSECGGKRTGARIFLSGYGKHFFAVVKYSDAVVKYYNVLVKYFDVVTKYNKVMINYYTVMVK
jgi:hypothetical protein